MPLNQKEVILRLILSIVCGGIIGIERESVNRPAGFRTHILVCIGSALTMLVSIFMYDQFKSQTNLDPSRIAAQVVSGIGFLGAGTIIREGANVRGLTTAASLWTIASVGLALGSGYYFAAGITTLFTFVTLVSFSWFEKHVIQRSFIQTISLTVKDKPGQIGYIGCVLSNFDINIRNVKMEYLENNILTIHLTIRVPSRVNINKVIEKLMQIDGVFAVDNLV